MGIFWVLFGLAVAAFVLEEFVLIKPVSTIARSDPLSRRIELAALWVPGIGMALTSLTASFVSGLWLGGIGNALGVLLCALGLGLRYWSRRTLGRFFTIGVVRQEGHRVIDTGPYRLLRHPGYFGFVLFYGGLPVIVGNWLGLLLLSLPALLIFVLLVRVEDERLTVELGSAYRSYRDSTDRWIPKLW